MDSEILFWTRFNFAVSSFCNELSHEDNSFGDLIHAMGGDELEWCDSSIITYLTKKYIHTTQALEDTNKRNQSLQAQLNNEIKHSQSLQNKLKNLKRTNEDSEWRLQEQVAQLHSLLHRSENHQNQSNMTSSQEVSLQLPKPMKDKSLLRPSATSIRQENLENLEISEANSIQR